MKKIRSKGQQPSNEDIIKYASLFENELTLDSLSRQQLIALCQILGIIINISTLNEILILGFNELESSSFSYWINTNITKTITVTQPFELHIIKTFILII